MKEVAPCMGCTNRHTACHGSCEAYKLWSDRHHAQQKQLNAYKSRWAIPWSASRDRLAQTHSRFGADSFKHGGDQ